MGNYISINYPPLKKGKTEHDKLIILDYPHTITINYKKIKNEYSFKLYITLHESGLVHILTAILSLLHIDLNFTPTGRAKAPAVPYCFSVCVRLCQLGTKVEYHGHRSFIREKFLWLLSHFGEKRQRWQLQSLL